MGNNMGPLNKQYTRIEATNDKEDHVVRVLRYYTVDVLGESEEHYEVIDLPEVMDFNLAKSMLKDCIEIVYGK